MNLFDVKRGTKGSVARFVREQVESQRMALVDRYREWALCLAFVRGHQHIDFDPKSNRWVRPNKNAWRTRATSNFLLPLVKKKVSRLALLRSVWDTIPATPDQEDIEIAQTSTKILSNAWDETKMSKKLLQVLFWLTITGNGFLKVGWDHEKGLLKEIKTKDIDDGLLDEYLTFAGLEEPPEVITTNKGELSLTVPTPFSICVDRDVTLFSDAKWAVQSSLRSLDWIVNAFGSKFKKLSMDNSTQADEVLHPLMHTDMTEHTRRLQKGFVVREFFEPPNNIHKDGIYSVSVGSEDLITPRPYPLEHGRIPIVQFIDVYDPLSVWGFSTVEVVRPAQIQYNSIQSVVVDHINTVGRAQWLVPRAAHVSQITNKPGEQIVYSGNLPPLQNKPANLPSYVENSMERARRDLQDGASSHNVSQGTNEPGLRSARAIEALQDADDSVDAATLQFFRDSLIDVGKLTLMTINQYVDTKEIIKVRGMFNELETLTYTGAMLRGKDQGDYFDVRVKLYSNQLMSRAGREAQILQYIQLGILHPERDKELILEMIGTGHVDMITEETEAEKVRQWNEIKQIAAGQPVEVMFGEDHEAHIKSIKKFMASSRREKIEPEALEKVQQHFIGHMEKQAKEFAFQQQLIQGAVSNGVGQSQQGNGQSGAGAGQARSEASPNSNIRRGN